MEDKNDDLLCVKQTLRGILDAQRKAKTHKYESSCKQSISDLSDQKYRNGTNKNTFPFILYGKDNKPFGATGVTTISCCSDKEKFLSIDTFIFKIKDLKDNCAILELLIFECEPTTDSVCYTTPSCQIDCKNVEDLISTGICITVDLSCFCAVSCLPAVHL